jgi:hypothetical protein
MISKGGSLAATIDINAENAIQDLYRYAGIDPSYWPDEVTKKEEDPLNPND